MDDQRKLEESVGYFFADPELLLQALTHKSWGSPDNERLEFLGDSVLELAVSHLLFFSLPQATEGELSKVRASLVREDFLAEVATGLQLGQYLRLGKGEEVTGGRQKASILASALEALIGAIYLDGGYGAALRVVERLFEDAVREGRWRDRDYKTQLQEYTQALFKETPHYVLLSEQGPEHSKTFEVAVYVKGELWGMGYGRSKKEAEQRAAQEALRRIREG